MMIPIAGWVAPFGYPRIKACSRLPMAFRSVPRPSSPPGAKASTECPSRAQSPHMHRNQPQQRREPLPMQTRPSEPIQLRSIYTRASDRLPPRLQQRLLPTGSDQPTSRRVQKRTNLFTCPKNTWIPDLMSPHRRIRASCSPKGARSDTPRDDANAAAIHGGGGRDRTDDPLLAKQVLSQLSYAPRPTEWWAREDSNLRPHAYQACALTN